MNSTPKVGHRNTAAARRYFEKSIDQNVEPETVTIDRSGANLAALEAINAGRETTIRIRQSKYLNNLIEQDHRAIKRRTWSMLGFKTFRCARILLRGIEIMHTIAKGQMKYARGIHPSIRPPTIYSTNCQRKQYFSYRSSFVRES
jgi:putative transposase